MSANGPYRPPLVLLPGLLNDEALWQAQIDHFGQDWNIFVPDMTRDTSIDAIAASILKQVQGQFILAGMSMGGYTALEIMRQAPGRVLKLALMNTSARRDSDEQTHHRKKLIILAGQGKFKGVTRRLLSKLVAPDHFENHNMAQAIFDMAERVGREGFIRQQTAIMNRSDQRSILAAIECPVLVVGGTQDQLTPIEWQQEIVDNVKNSQLEILDNCGHLSPLEQPEKLNIILEKWI